MILNPDCIACSIKGTLNLFKKGLLDSKYQEEVLRKILEYYSKVDYNQLTISAGKQVKKIICEVTGIIDPYKPLKDEYNKKAIEYCKKYENIIKNDPNSFDKAMRLAIAGNIIDFGPTHDFDVDKKIEEVFKTNFPIDDSAELSGKIKKAKSILYLGDNTGEIVFDKLFLEVINHTDVTFVVRHRPVLNDATMEDALFVGLDKIVSKVITNGDNAPGTLLDCVSQEFLDYFNSADLIISKGQGNFEGLSHIKDKNIFFLLTVKCQLIADEIGVNEGDCIVKSQLKHQEKKGLYDKK
ncbi:MAG: ARMT1-like domain-containing protein [Candidatus Gastranaerophilales bacterium]|nr:ARMT1-like domain-containing protein [Candidatus Gastranaerophilales bacterium]